jgi:hypothetical protein
MLRGVVSFLTKSGFDTSAEFKGDVPSIRELLGVAASWAGKGKDEVIQMVCREIGIATAAVLKEPLTQVVENQKLLITLEFSPKKKGVQEKKRTPARPRR